MRSQGNDIVELFGYAPDDTSKDAVRHLMDSTCPFSGNLCSKTNHDQSVIYGTCAVTGGKNAGSREEVIICPKRLYAEGYKIFEKVTAMVWGELPVIVGGTLEDLCARALQHDECVVAFGQNSGREITVNSNGKLSMDWVLQRYTSNGLALAAQDFLGIEVQSIDITGNYRETFAAYAELKKGRAPSYIPVSGHGLNWANVHKRLIPQIIRKGNVYSKSNRCIGFFFILPEQVYTKFDEVLGCIDEEDQPSRKNLSVLTYVLDGPSTSGQMRRLRHTATKHHSLENIAVAFSTNTDAKAPDALDSSLSSIL